MARRRQIFEGKAKILFEGPEPGTLVQYFKDESSARTADDQPVITGKGVLNNRISELLLTRLGEVGIPTHLVRRLNMREQLVREVEIIPIEIKIRNIATGCFAQRFGISEGTPLPRSIIEYYYKSDDLGNPLVAEEHITAFGWATPQDLDDIMSLSLRINDFLSGFFLGIGMRLMDLKLEFGRLWEDEQVRIILADEICPDSCTLWNLRQDTQSNQNGDIANSNDQINGYSAYHEVARRLGLIPEGCPSDVRGLNTLQ